MIDKYLFKFVRRIIIHSRNHDVLYNRLINEKYLYVVMYVRSIVKLDRLAHNIKFVRDYWPGYGISKKDGGFKRQS